MCLHCLYASLHCSWQAPAVYANIIQAQNGTRVGVQEKINFIYSSYLTIEDCSAQ